jgi:DNA-directed RNA polymerase beta subunit
MPYDETGASPDIIVNPHCLPTRMTVGQLVEALAIVAARRGTQYDCTAFLPVEHYAIATALYDAGLRYNGRRRLYDGRTGEHMDAAIFMAPTGQQRLLKFVLNDEQSVGSNSQTDATTGQPMRGRDHGGGLKLGEMENWGLESHGSMYSLQEKCSGDSDGRAWHICRGCGAPAVFNAKRGIYGCQICGELADIETVASCKTAQVFHEELAGSNIRMQLGLQPRTYEVRQE